MTRAKIRAALILRGITVTAIGARIGVARQTITNVISGHRRTPFVRRAIAEAVGKPYMVVWNEPDPGYDRSPKGNRLVYSATHSHAVTQPGPAQQ